MTIQINGTSGISGVDGSAATPALQGTDTNTGISFGTDEVNINTGGTTRATVDSSGRLLVGTSIGSSSATLQLQGSSSSSTSQPSIFLRRGSSPGSSDALGYLIFGDNSENQGAYIGVNRDGGTWTSGSSHPSRLVFSTTANGASSPTERVRINSNGKIGLGSSTIYAGGLVSNAYVTAFTASSSSSGSVGAEFYGNGTGTLYHIAFGNPNGLVGSIYTSGSATTYNTSSDYRLKENVKPLTGAINRLNNLKPCRFNFIANPDLETDGFLAHEAQEVVPQAVDGYKDAVDEDGKPQYQGIDHSKLVPLLTAALQEAIAKIETLETRLTALEGGNP